VLGVGFDSTAYEFGPRFLHRFGRVWPDAEIELYKMSCDEQAQVIAVGDGGRAFHARQRRSWVPPRFSRLSVLG